ncbi:gonadotropin-releasing hormone receptor [Nephila pilipes]|uniref:Gonadotropin-releasing hormone receptor n=1 Tax=Nephila pilipes TaxID=299642 RepID=A0A8X6PKQ0_NEPPI|nr:gonadotropin-releasing hormone receptor [Nephila pilipes]
MNTIVCIVYLIACFKFISTNPFKNDNQSSRQIGASLVLDEIPKTEKSFKNFHSQPLSTLKNIERNSNSLVPQISLVAVSSLESDIISIKDRDNFNRDDYFYPKPPLLEETVYTSNFSHIETNCTPNSTDLCHDLGHAPQFENSTLTKGLILSFIAFFSFIGNVTTLASIIRVRRKGTSTVYMLLFQLAIADLLVTLFCILAEGLWTLTVAWYGGNLLCKMVKFLQMFALYLSTYVLVLIGFDRLCAVRFPMQRAHAKHHVRRGIVCIWIMSGVFSLPQGQPPWQVFQLRHHHRKVTNKHHHHTLADLCFCRLSNCSVLIDAPPTSDATEICSSYSSLFLLRRLLSGMHLTSQAGHVCRAASFLIIFLVPGLDGSDTEIGLFLHLQLTWGRFLTSVFSTNEEGALRFRQFLLTGGLLLL